MLTGDAAVNPGAPIICATAEVLANHALRDRELADIGLVVMDEFHFYTEPDRGWAWQVPLLLLPDHGNLHQRNLGLRQRPQLNLLPRLLQLHPLRLLLLLNL